MWAAYRTHSASDSVSIVLVLLLSLLLAEKRFTRFKLAAGLHESTLNVLANLIQLDQRPAKDAIVCCLLVA